jgi:hypothetical protein
VFATFGIGSGGTGLSSSAHARNGAATNSERDHVAVSKYLTRMISPFPKCAPKQSESMLGEAAHWRADPSPTHAGLC